MFKKAIIATSIAVILSGCGADDRAYDTVDRSPKEISVASLDTESLWLFMPSTGETPRYAMTQRGFFQGDPKLVSLRFDEFNGIYVEEVDRDKVSTNQDSRWGSEINKAPVLKIPGEFRQYRCAENDYDECTNREEINKDDDFDWKKATHFIPKYEDIKPLAQDTLRAWFTASNVTESADPRLVSYEYDPKEGVINVEIERTFTADPEDQYQFGSDLADLSFKTRFFYSLVKLDKLASKDYEPVYYQGQDSAYYGFFNDAKSVKTATGESNVQGSKFAYINRFNPNMENIEYYLSDSYFADGMDEYRQLTIDTIAQVNKNLEGTGVPNIKIMNPKAKAGVRTGDLRYNSFNLIADPVDNGLLGYGPSATNPLTGEIVHAHVNQYLGVILSATRHYWEDLALRYNRQEIAKLEPKEEEAADDAADVAVASDEDPTSSKNWLKTIHADVPEVDTSSISSFDVAMVTREYQPDALPKADFDFKYDTESKDLAMQSFYKRKEMLKRLSEQNYYSIDNMWLSTQSKGLVRGIDYAEGGFFTAEDQTALKKWDALTEEQQKTVTMAISKHMFKSTLIHELGHNLGLRHNFMGSTDKDKFYTEDELSVAREKGKEQEAKGEENTYILQSDKPAAYSSIMDYGASIFDELLAFGKYDKAALKFGYARELEINADQVDLDADKKATPRLDATGAIKKQTFSLAKFDKALTEDYNAYPTGIITHLRRNGDEEGLPAPILGYRYCTDEHTTTNLLCNRFDEGTNLTEVTQFRIQRYKDSYDTMNRRNGRDSFYRYHQYNYFLSRWSQFQEIRDIIENVGDIDRSFADYIGANQVNTEGMVFQNLANSNCRGSVVPRGFEGICDTYKATLEASDFFLDILNTPDKICEVEEIVTEAGVPNRYRFIKLSQLWEQNQSDSRFVSANRDVPTSCFDKEIEDVLAALPNKTVIRSESKGGKIMSSLKANNPHQSSSTSVDLLGTWPDKLLAAQMLVRRDTPSVATERSNLALVDIDGKVAELYSYIYGLANVPDGDTKKVTFVDRDGKDISTVEKYEPSVSDLIEATPSYLWPMKRYFGLGGDEAFNYWTEGAWQDTRVPYFAALLNNISKFSRQDQYGLSDTASGLRDGVHLNYAESYNDDDDRSITFSRKGRKYQISYRNFIGQRLANVGLYKTEQVQHVNTLNDPNAPSQPRWGSKYPTPRVVLGPLQRAEGKDLAQRVKEIRLIALRDMDVFNGIVENRGFSLFFYLRNNFIRYDKDDNVTTSTSATVCQRFKADGEDEATRKSKRVCYPQALLDNISTSVANIDDDRFDVLKKHAEVFANNYNVVLNGGSIERWDANLNRYGAPQNYRARPEIAEIFTYPAEELISWLDNDYNEYRRVLEQFPIYTK